MPSLPCFTPGAVVDVRLKVEHLHARLAPLAQRGGQPKKKPYPTAAEFEAIRAAAELPSCW